MKKIYFALVFSIFFLLLSPGMKAEAKNQDHYVTTSGTNVAIVNENVFISFTVQNPNSQHNSIYLVYLSKSSEKCRYYYYSELPVTSGNGYSYSPYSSMNGFSFSGYYCYIVCSDLSSDTHVDFYTNFDSSNHYDIPYSVAADVASKLANGEDPFYVLPTYKPDFSGLGYLKGLGKYYKEQTVYSQNTNLFGIKRYVISDRKYIFGWDAESTSGVQLSDENISVNVKVQLFGNRSTLSGETVPIKCNGTIVDFGNVPASAFYYSTSLAEFLVKFDFSDTNDLNGDKKPIFYFRLERKNDDNTVTYGNTLKFDPSAPISYISDSITSSPEGTITVGDLTDSGFVVDGSIESETVTGQGISGSSWEEVTINSNMNFVQDNSMITNIESFLSQIGSIPRIVGVLFSFLPSWCLGFVGLGLGMLVTVLVVKVVRG